MNDSRVLTSPPVRQQGAVAALRSETVGEVALGDDVLLLGSPLGGLLDVPSSAGSMTVRPRPRPVLDVPPAPSAVLGRQSERAALARAIADRLPLEFHGEPGIGRTTLLKYLAHNPPARPPDGIVFLSARAQPLADLLQQIHDRFVESTPPRKATQEQVGNALADLQAIVLLDDVQIEGEEVSVLLDVLPRSVVVLASERPRLGDRGLSVPLAGLSVVQGVALLQHALGRPLDEEELRSASTIIRAIQGNPLRLRQQVSLLTESGVSLADVAATLHSPADQIEGLPEAVRPRSPAEFRVLTLLAAVPDAALTLADIAALTDMQDAGDLLRRMERRGLVEDELGTERYRLVRDLVTLLEGTPETEQWRASALSYFKGFVRANSSMPDRMVGALEPSRVLLRWAIAAERWPAALDLARGIEGCLALARRWGAWAEVLQAAHMATRALGDEAGRAWVLHQLGTRSLCLGSAAGHAALVESLQIREQLGDLQGAEVAQHNLVCPLSSLAATGSLSRIRADRSQDPTEPIRVGSSGAGAGRGWTSILRPATLAKLTSVLVLLCGMAVIAGAIVGVGAPVTEEQEAVESDRGGEGPVSPSLSPWRTPTIGRTLVPTESQTGDGADGATVPIEATSNATADGQQSAGTNPQAPAEGQNPPAPAPAPAPAPPPNSPNPQPTPPPGTSNPSPTPTSPPPTSPPPTTPPPTTPPPTTPPPTTPPPSDPPDDDADSTLTSSVQGVLGLLSL